MFSLIIEKNIVETEVKQDKVGKIVETEVIR